jgi:hypothetical protein
MSDVLDIPSPSDFAPVVSRSYAPTLDAESYTAASSGGGRFTGTLVLDSGELLGVVDGRIDSASAEKALGLSTGKQRRKQ